MRTLNRSKALGYDFGTVTQHGFHGNYAKDKAYMLCTIIDGLENRQFGAHILPLAKACTMGDTDAQCKSNMLVRLRMSNERRTIATSIDCSKSNQAWRRVKA